MPNPILLAYATTKGAIQNFTGGLAQMLAGKGIRVNAVAPGPIESPGAARQLWNTAEAVDRITRTVPLGRWGTPADVADAVAFLVSDHASFITGETLTIDGAAWLGRGLYSFLDAPR
jgi:NAD(P)-dependent dehydrogenase (short-subunit alcohol dehydrogenase family)